MLHVLRLILILQGLLSPFMLLAPFFVHGFIYFTFPFINYFTFHVSCSMCYVYFLFCMAYFHLSCFLLGFLCMVLYTSLFLSCFLLHTPLLYLALHVLPLCMALHASLFLITVALQLFWSLIFKT